MNYKEALERSNSILSIQRAYENECEKRLRDLEEVFPEDYITKFLNTHLSIWLIAEKVAIYHFGQSSRHWIRQKI
jgi:hypothetical protein